MNVKLLSYFESFLSKRLFLKVKQAIRQESHVKTMTYVDYFLSLETKFQWRKPPVVTEFSTAITMKGKTSSNYQSLIPSWGSELARAANGDLLLMKITHTSKANMDDYDERTGIVNHSKDQQPTPAEVAFRESLLMMLRANGIVSEIGIQEFLVIPLEKRNKSKAVAKQLAVIERRHASAKFTLRRPDFLCEKYGFVVEIDGSAHDSNDKRIRRDVTREAEYALLGLHCFVVYNHQIFNPDEKATVLKEILSFITGQRKPGWEHEMAYQRRRTAICRARKKFKALTTNFDIGSFDRKRDEKVEFPDGIGIKQWGGYRFETR